MTLLIAVMLATAFSLSLNNRFTPVLAQQGFAGRVR